MYRRKLTLVGLFGVCCAILTTSCTKAPPPEEFRLPPDAKYVVATGQFSRALNADNRGKVLVISPNGQARVLDTGERPKVSHNSTTKDVVVADPKMTYWIQPGATTVRARSVKAPLITAVFRLPDTSTAVLINPGIRSRTAGSYSPIVIEHITSNGATAQEIAYGPVIPNIAQCADRFYTTTDAADISRGFQGQHLMELDPKTAILRELIKTAGPQKVSHTRLICGSRPNTLIAVGVVEPNPDTRRWLHIWDLATKTTKLYPIPGTDITKSLATALHQSASGRLWLTHTDRVLTAPSPEGPWSTAFDIPIAAKNGAVWFETGLLNLVYQDNKTIRLLTYDITTGQQSQNLTITPDRPIPFDFAIISGQTLRQG